jgi:hypothetical protein
MSANLAEDLTALGWPIHVVPSTLGGLGVVASRDIAAGEVVASEAPLALTPLYAVARQVCWHCMQEAPGGIEQPLPCAACSVACWCSEACRHAGTASGLAAGLAHAHGQVECAALRSWQQAGRLHADVADLTLQAIRLLDVGHRGASCRPLPPPSATRLGFEAYVSRLCGMRRNAQTADAIRRAAAAALASVAADARVEPAVLEDVLSRHQCNVYGISGPGAAGLGLASFVCVLHLFNHSCAPNVAFDSRPIDIAFDSRPISTAPVPGSAAAPGPVPARVAPPPPSYALIALRPIRASVELVHCYASSADGPAVRQAYLRAHHGFQCGCPRCACDDPVAELEMSEGLDARRCIRAACGSGIGVHTAARVGGEEAVVGRGAADAEGGEVGLRCVHCGEVWQVDELDVM